MSDKVWGATPEDWFLFDTHLGLGSEMLPVVSNPNAVISESSSLKKLGKVPSLYNSAGRVVGIPNWTSHKTTDSELAEWSVNPDYGICLQARTVRAFDIDVEDFAVVKAILESFDVDLFPRRCRVDSAKFLIPFYLDAPCPKRVLHFQKEGVGQIEWLGDGQQFVAAGTHQNGARYEWLNLTDIPTLTLEDAETIWNRWRLTFLMREDREGSSSRVKSTHVDIPDPIADKIRQHPAFIEEGRDRQLLIECPFKEEHTGDSGKTETSYFPKGSNGHAEGHFVCQHAHCRGRLNFEFEKALGFVDDEFDVSDDAETVIESASEEKKKDRGWKLYKADEYVALPRPKWIIDGILPMAQLGALYGESGAGKTFCALDMAMCIARGIKWNDRETVKGRVVYIAAEGAGGFRNRLEAYKLHNELESYADIPFEIFPGAPDFLNKSDVVAVSELVKSDGAGGRASVIFVDTLAQVSIGGNENSGEDMSKVIANCHGLSMATGAMVVLIHHAGKDLERGLRGWSGLKGALDVSLEVLKGDGDTRTLRVEKLKDGRDGEAWSFTLVEVELPADDPLDESETSPVVEYLGEVKVGVGAVRADHRPKISSEFGLLLYKNWCTAITTGSITSQRLIELAAQDYYSEAAASGGPVGKSVRFVKIQLDTALRRLRLRDIASVDDDGFISFVPCKIS